MKRTPTPKLPKARTVKCVVTGKSIEYAGYGRPPKYHPSVRAKVERDRRAAAYAAKNKGRKPGKRGRPRKAA